MPMFTRRFRDRVQLQIHEGVAQVRLDRPDKHNGMDLPMLQAVIEACRALRRRRELRAVVIAGEGPSFCAGLDFKTVMSRPVSASLGVAQLWWPGRNDFQHWSMGWRELGVPVIAAVHGHCLGAGLQLALGADLRIATPDAQLSFMEARWGLVPDMGGPTLMRELLPIDVAKELTFTGRVISGAEAQRIGLVTHVDADPLAHAQRLAAEIATRSPDAVAAAKFLLQEAWHADEETALGSERRWQRRLVGRPNQRKAMRRSETAPSFGPRRV